MIRSPVIMRRIILLLIALGVSAVWPAASQAAPKPADPVRLSIPAIGVKNAVVEPRWTDKKGVMIPPSSAWRVGWYQHSVRPGEPGSAVMYGHINTSRSRTGVFTRLNRLQTGDRLTVIDAKKVRRTYIVRRVHLYRTENIPLKQLTAKRSKSYLNLYTCAGTWSPRRRDYTHRIVITTELIGQPVQLAKLPK